MLNIHPSLLPAFPGLDTHARALAAGVKLHGCTVHLVTQEMDAGPILAQAAVPVLPGDTEDDLAARVLRQEHRLSGGAGRFRWPPVPRVAGAGGGTDQPAGLSRLAGCSAQQRRGQVFTSGQPPSASGRKASSSGTVAISFNTS